jgi:uncharacterized protein (TIGR02001 family)
MRHTRILAIAGLSTALLGTANADIETSISAGYTSEYNFRGVDNGDDLFDATIEVSGSGSLGGLGDIDWGAGLWLAAFGDNDNEMDIYMSASKSLSDNLDLTVGVTNYSYYGGAAATPDDLEPYIGLGTCLGGITLGLTANFDESDTQDHDIYWELTAGYEMELSSLGTLGLSGVIGHFDDVAAGEEDTYYGISASLSIAVSDSITVTPHITHLIDTKDADGDDDETFAGVSVGFAF